MTNVAQVACTLACVAFAALASNEEKPTALRSTQAHQPTMLNGPGKIPVHPLVADEQQKLLKSVDSSATAATQQQDVNEFLNQGIVANDPESVKKMEATVMELVKNSKGKTVKKGTPMATSVQNMKDLIEKVMLPKVYAAHSTSQNELNGLNKQMSQGCGGLKKAGESASRMQKTAYESASVSHKSCRTMQAAIATQLGACKYNIKAKYQLWRHKQRNYHRWRRYMGSQRRNMQIARRRAGESITRYVDRITHTYCGTGSKHTIQSRYHKARKDYYDARTGYLNAVRDCRTGKSRLSSKKQECNNVQLQMDSASCQRAVMVKDSCEAYNSCYVGKKIAFQTAEKRIKKEEVDRKSEYKALKRMQCLIDGFADGQVSDLEVTACKSKVHSTTALNIAYPPIPRMEVCTVPDRYPATAAYKKAEFAPLPALARGNPEANECYGVLEISTTPRAGSPSSCKCVRMTMNGPFSPGALVKCTGCLDVKKSQDKNSCPDGTKIFSPRNQADWKTFAQSAGVLKDPNFIVDITRPQDGKASEVVGPSKECASSKVQFGDRFIQLGDWRFADIDGRHASMAHKSGKTAEIYRSDGTLHRGPRTDFTTWKSRKVGTPKGISFGDRFIQIGQWRIGDVDGTHLSIAHQNGKTALIFRSDGTLHRGPRRDFTTFSRGIGPPSQVSFGDRFIQIGKWRLGDVDGAHASMAHKYGKTALIYRNDGTLHPGPRRDFSTWSRKLTGCEYGVGPYSKLGDNACDGGGGLWTRYFAKSDCEKVCTAQQFCVGYDQGSTGCNMYTSREIGDKSGVWAKVYKGRGYPSSPDRLRVGTGSWAAQRKFKCYRRNTQAGVNTKVSELKTWVTSDGSPWWLRSTVYSQPSGDYTANCYMDVVGIEENNVRFDDKSCSYHSKSYYCQKESVSTTPKLGSPSSCRCQNIQLSGSYTAGALLKCIGCLRVRRSMDKNSCPEGTKLFSPRSRGDWQTFIDSATPLRSPYWIVDVTRPRNGCGGCTRSSMNAGNSRQTTWRTADGSPWWLRSSRYNEPNGDYSANCYLDLWSSPKNADYVTFNDGRCNYYANSYYCQPVKSPR